LKSTSFFWLELIESTLLVLFIYIYILKITIWLQFYAPKFNMIIKSYLKSPRFFFGWYSLTWRHSMIIFTIITLRRTSSSSVFKSIVFNASTCTRIPISQNGLQLVNEILNFFYVQVCVGLEDTYVLLNYSLNISKF
jgi:hypothetical protein